MPSQAFATVGWAHWDVPRGVKTINVTIDGAGSGSNPGGRVTGKLAVSDRWNLYFLVGGAARLHSGATRGGGVTGGGAAGGGGHGSGGVGGNGGGGASAIRVNSTTGTLKAVAGGAGGNSGDGGVGGMGGGPVGESGHAGTSGDNPTERATGGTTSQGGNGGTSASGSQFYGKNAIDAILATAGAGGDTSGTLRSHGGGGGGGGYRAGGGGQAASIGYAPGGGGGGGSSYTGGLTGAASYQGGGGTGNGSVVISWTSPPPANLPPSPPTTVQVNKVDAAPGMLTKAKSSVRITAVLNDPNKNAVKMIARWSASPSFSSYRQVASPRVATGKTAALTLTGLGQNRHYYVRLYSVDDHNKVSTGYTSIDFLTNQPPRADSLTVNTQGSGMTLPTNSSATFAWMHNDPDVSDFQSGFEINYRTKDSSTQAAGAWTVVNHNAADNLPPKTPGPPSSAKNQWVFDPGTFKGNRFYEWRVRTKDGEGLWGAFSLLFSFYTTSTHTPPILRSPTNHNAVDMTKAATFTWQFIDPDPANTQQKADLQYRVVGNTKDLAHGLAPANTGWVLLPTVATTSGSATVLPGTFVAGYTYEWQVRTYDLKTGVPSDWSDSFVFYAIGNPGALADPLPIPENAKAEGELGCGSYRVFIYQQGGQIRLGEVEPVSSLTFSRLRDDISNSIVQTNGYSSDCGAFYSTVRSWMHEIVVFRDGVRVWEGPITRITYTPTSVEFEAKDVMAYAYRRILRTGYNDAYRLIKKGTGGKPNEYLGLLSVVERAAMLLIQGLAPYDPNVLPYLTAIQFPDDARESRVVADWSRMVWEEVDDLAATAGLDYTTVGRRILLWDTHRPVGRIPELRDGDFSDSPVVTEYGMQLSNFLAVTNNSGAVGFNQVSAKSSPYGPVEMLASSYSDSSSAAPTVVTAEALAAMQSSLEEQAKRNISGRWPTPLVVRIPDSSTLNPKANVGFQQLIPGVWMPLRSVNTPRPVLQWQKLDSVSVEASDAGESVKIVVSPAPHGGEDPDADSAGDNA